MITSPVSTLAAGITAAASIITGFMNTATAQADVTGNGLTLAGNTFQVGQQYTLTGQFPTAGTYSIYDTTDGVTRFAGTVSGPGPVPFQWETAVAGSHQIFATSGIPAGDSVPAATFGPITVEVTGTSTASALSSLCWTPNNYSVGFNDAGPSGCFGVSGTPQVGCTLTLAMPVQRASTGSAFNVAMLSTQGLAAKVYDNGELVGSAPTVSGNGFIQWSPSTAGVHHLTATVPYPDWTTQQVPVIPSGSYTPGVGMYSPPIDVGAFGSAMANLGLDTLSGVTSQHELDPVWVTVAPKGTNGCA